jgi:hypothetical protein
MPTDFDWRKYRKQQMAPEPPPPPPAGFVITSWIFNAFFYVFLGISAVSLWNFVEDANQTLKIVDHCNDQKGVAVRTIRGDAVCIKEDVLTQVLNAKNTNQAK